MAEDPSIIPETESEPPVDETSAARDRPQATEIKPPSAARRLRYNLFNRETRSGRFFRGLLRWLAILVILVGGTLLAGYLLFYQPLEDALNQVRASAAETTVDLERVQKELADSQADMRAAQAREKEAQERLDVELTRVQLLRAVASLRTAHAAIEAEDQAAAEEAVTTAEETLANSQARFDRVDPNSSSTLQALFTLVRNGLDRDMATVVPDLERLIAELIRLDTEMQ